MNFNKIMLSIGLISILASCTNDLDKHCSYSKGITFKAQVSQNKELSTRYKQEGNENKWEKGDAIGISMFPEEGMHWRENYKYLSDGNNGFTAANDKNILSFDDTKEIADFTAYYPYTDLAKGNEEFDVDITNTKDILYSDNAQRSRMNGKSVVLRFSHKLSKLTLNVTSEKLNDHKIILTTRTKGKFNTTTGELTANEETAEIIKQLNNKTISIFTIPESEIAYKIVNDKDKVVKEGIFDKKTLDGQDLSTNIIYDDGSIKFSDSNIKDWEVIDGPEITIGDDDTQEKTNIIFKETFGTANHPVEKVDNKWPSVGNWKYYDNKDLTFDFKFGSIRRKADYNAVYYSAGYTNTMTITGFSTKGLKKINVSYKLYADIFKNTDETDLARCTGTINGKPFITPSKKVTEKNKWYSYNFDIELTDDQAEGKLCFTVEADPNYDKDNKIYGVGLAITDIQLTAGEGGSVDPVDPTPDPEKDKVIFYENFGNEKVEKKEQKFWPYVSTFKGFISGATFKDINKTLSIRWHGNKNNSEDKGNNCIWFPKKKDNKLSISNINATGYDKLMFTFMLNANETSNTSCIEGSFNGKKWTVTPTKLSRSFNWTKFEVELDTEGATDNSELTIHIPNVKENGGIRFAQLKITSGKENNIAPNPTPNPNPDPEPTPQPEDPTNPQKEVLFNETFDGPNGLSEKGSQKIELYKGYTSGMKFEQINGQPEIRFRNNIGLPFIWMNSMETHSIKISKFDTTNYKSLKLKVNIQGERSDMPYNDVKYIFNDIEVNKESIILPDKEFMTMEHELPITNINSESSLIIQYKSTTGRGIRISNIMIEGTR